MIGQKYLLKFNNLFLREKLIIILLSIIILVSIIIGFASYKVLENYAIKRIDDSNLNTLITTMQSIDNRLKEFDRLLYNILTSERLGKMLEDNSINKAEFEAYQSEFADEIFYSIFGSRAEYVESVYIFGENGLNLFSNYDPFVIYNYNQILQLPTVKRAEEAKGKMIWLPTSNNIFVEENYKFDNLIITGLRKLYTTMSSYSNDYKEWGYLAINIDEKYIKETYNHLNKNGSRLFITDNNGKIISHADSKMLTKATDKQITNSIKNRKAGNFTVRTEGRAKRVYFYTSSYTGWKMIYLIDANILSNSIAPLRNTIFMIVFFIVILAIILSYYLAEKISNPIHLMAEKMQQVRQGNLDIKIDVESHDELGMLSKTFNYMVNDIKNLMNKVKEDQELLRKTELEALQSQINPHFLYNTLDSIYCLSRADRIKDISEVTLALSDFFRLSLNDGKSLTTIDQELEQVKSYLKIEQISNEELFDYDIDIEDSVRKNECVNNIIQPLIENSIKHGFINIDSGGFIKVSAYLENEVVIIEVRDNGCGLDIELAENILIQENTSSGYGIYNVNQRIQLRYGNRYGLDFSLAERVGTIIKVKLPHKPFQEKGNQDV